MAVSTELIRELRERTGLGIMDCKTALAEASGDVEEAITILRKKGLKAAEKRSSRATSEGRIGSYVHMNGTIATLVELNCETDFVARNEEFQALLKDLCMQVAASEPVAVSREDLPEEALEKEREIYREQFAGKPPEVLDRIVEGKLKSYYEEACLLEQPFVRDPEITVEERIQQAIAKFGEKLAVSRFVRMKMGEEI